MHHFYFCCFLKGSTRKKKVIIKNKPNSQPPKFTKLDSAEGKLQPFQYAYVVTGRKENECIFHIESINHGT